MSIAPREAKCLRSWNCWPGQPARLGHLVKTASSGLDRRRVAGRAALGRLGRRARGRCALTACGAGETTCGITSPARSTITSSPARTSLRAMSSSLCSVASLTVTPPTPHRLEHGERVQVAELAHVPLDALEHGGLRRRRELPGDGPARLAAHDAQAALQLDVVDLDDDAVDLEAQAGAALLPGLALGHDVVLAVEQLDVVVDREAVLAQPLSASHWLANAIPSVAPMP